MKFQIHALRQDGKKVFLHYDNQLSTLTWQDGTPVVPVQPGSFRGATVVSVNQPGRKGQVRILKISLRAAGQHMARIDFDYPQRPIEPDDAYLEAVGGSVAS
mgnify:CR=1 FL=1